MDWDKLRIFYAVAQAKSLTRAGEALSLSQSAVSRQISALEDKMKVTLFHRHARGLLLTEQGEILFRAVSEMVAKLNQTEVQIAESSEKPKGPFRITASTAIGTIWLAPLLKEFLNRYPDIEITLIVDDRELDLAMREADVALRMYPSRHPDLVQRKLLNLSNSIYASSDYLSEFGIPKTAADLKKHRLITYPSHLPPPFPNVNWLNELPEVKKLRLEPYIQMNSLNAIRRAVKAGMGIAALPDYMMYRARHVSKILTGLPALQTEAYYVYPLELKHSRRVAVFRQFIERKIQEFDFGFAYNQAEEQDTDEV
jgi:DNA-binding transcriptional LysR family regulator